MLLFQGLLEYERSSPWPERTAVSIQLKHNLNLTLDIPNFGVVARSNNGETRSPLTPVVLAHASFKTAMQPALVPDEAFYKRCTAEANAISLFFPDIKDDGIRVAFAAWLAFACVMDDTLETFDIGERQLTLAETVEVLKHAPLCRPPSGVGAGDQRVQAMARVLFDHCTRYLSSKSAVAFFAAVCEVLEAHIDEIHFLQGRHNGSFAAYLGIRRRTIALSPFFEVLKTELLGPGSPAWAFSDAWLSLQREVSQAAGLQNDLIGLVRDLEDGEDLNAVVVLMRGFRGGDTDEPDPAVLARCVAMVNAEHNQSVARALEHMAQLHRAAEATDGCSVEAVERVARHILMMAETHLRWCSSAKRYRLEVGVDGGLPAASRPSHAPARTPPAETPVTADSLVIQSKGIFHGLPTFPDTPDCRGLTAVVTGATGLSGYSMVKVLAAAPQRWRKIYCLSSRPPPEHFFSDLGDGARRVEHLAVNFLDAPATIAEQLKAKIDHIDHIFYFSYTQPAPKGDVLDLWANADELVTANVTLFTNLLAALRLSALHPRRFLLQTGTKHYAFYLGRASVPAFETDPRVRRAGDRNFYYEQEDALAAYCASVGGGGGAASTAWSVTRPSYIVGAARDGALNHLLGVAVYAAVQARLGAPLAFPGDYAAWDREQVQSTAGLNAYFAEWVVLTAKAAGEAYNVHDGLSFTWGRLWECLGKWFGVPWTPPERKEGRYRDVTLPGESTRGYGPQTTLRSTFTLLEWSQQAHVESAWRELAREHQLVLDPFDAARRARVFAFADSALIGDAPMTASVRKARAHGFFGTVDSYRAAFDALREMARLRLVPPMVVDEFEG